MKSDVKFRFGGKLRTIRERKNMTMKQVGKIIGVSESLISQIERNKVSPSLDTLIAIAEVLQVDLEYLFKDLKKSHTVDIIRKEDRNNMQLKQVRYEQLTSFSDPGEKHAVEAFQISLEPGFEKGDLDYGHEGKELGIITEGEGTFSYGTEEYVLNEGDSISFPSDIPHILKNTGECTLKAVWVITPPRLFTEK